VVKGLETRVRFRMTPEDHPLSTREKALVVTLSMTSHARWVVWTVTDSLNHGMAPGVYLATRAFLEVTAILAYLLVQYRLFKDGKRSEADLDTICNRLILSRRHRVKEALADKPHLKGQVEAIGVMDLVDSVDKVYGIPELKGRFRDNYEWFSEFCHPNSLAQIASGFALDKPGVVFPASPQIDELDVKTALHGVYFGYMVFRDCYDDLVELLGGLPPEEAAK
jgi:hypothetical protein